MLRFEAIPILGDYGKSLLTADEILILSTEQEDNARLALSGPVSNGLNEYAPPQPY